MGASSYTRANLLKSLFGQISAFGALASAPAFHMGFSSTQPGPDGSGVTEQVGAGYARVLVATIDWATATEADPAIITNVNAIAWPTAPTADWFAGEEAGWTVFYDAATAGNFLDWGTIASPRKFLLGDPAPSVAVGQVSLELGDE